MAALASYDIFLSYDLEVEMQIFKLYDTLTDKYDLKLWSEHVELKPGENNFTMVSDAISKSKLMICCLTQAYTKSLKCRNEITLAFTNDKKIFALMFENLQTDELKSISFAMTSNMIKLNLYEHNKAIDSWSGELIDQLMSSLETCLGRELNMIGAKRHHRKSKSSIRKDSTLSSAHSAGSGDAERLFKSVLTSTIVGHTENNNVHTITVSTEERFVNDDVVLDERARLEKQCLLDNQGRIRLRRLRCTSLFQLLAGFNRICVYEPKQLFYVTSSYNRSIVLIDTNGNWVERRNPNSLLKKPWGICINKKTNELFIGDNGHRCIFQFDLNFKHIGTFGEKLLSGYYDLTVEEHMNEIYAANIYDSVVVVIDLKTYEPKRKIYVASPSFVRVSGQYVFIVCTDYLYVIEKDLKEIKQTIKLPSTDYMNGIYVDKESNIYTTAYSKETVTTTQTNTIPTIQEEGDADPSVGLGATAANTAPTITTTRSRNVYLYVIRLLDKEVIRKVNLGLTQVNDFIIHSGRMSFLCDTHLDIFEFDGLN